MVWCCNGRRLNFVVDFALLWFIGSSRSFLEYRLQLRDILGQDLQRVLILASLSAPTGLG